ncbi:nitrite reductase [Novimethylophilus kurashikiensis]|uniref:Nitrite reductase n=1 Tax=Novimethylophilus kurashikiensis TaxID=1825523 RepID=A0A2R5F7N3_9PROT|nr:non-heme iron oxygenase ferredoxin subunit [Novimethylophilus kurashikiensis]GBG12691.1 nitrite reductase [Novimethylophilus kurashikiensis]
MNAWIDVAAADDWPSGTCKVADHHGLPIAVFNLQGRFYATDNICTHEYAELCGGAIEGEEIVCPWHGARFSIPTGKVNSAPAYEDLKTYPVRVEGGMVQVDAEG